MKFWSEFFKLYQQVSILSIYDCQDTSSRIPIEKLLEL